MSEPTTPLDAAWEAAEAEGYREACLGCGHSMNAHTSVTNDGCVVDGCLCEMQDAALSEGAD